MRRRKILKALVLATSGFAAIKAAAAASNSAPDASKLPFKRVSVKEDASRVVFFFDFGFYQRVACFPHQRLATMLFYVGCQVASTFNVINNLSARISAEDILSK